MTSIAAAWPLNKNPQSSSLPLIFPQYPTKGTPYILLCRQSDSSATHYAPNASEYFLELKGRKAYNRPKTPENSRKATENQRLQAVTPIQWSSRNSQPETKRWLEWNLLPTRAGYFKIDFPHTVTEHLWKITCKETRVLCMSQTFQSPTRRGPLGLGWVISGLCQGQVWL